MLISIIIPAFNIDKYLSVCLESIVCQNSNSIEVIVINDGSTDNTGIIADEFADNYEHIHVVHQNNLGVSAARNHGLQIAQGEYIWFVDGDDLLAPDSINNLSNIIKKYHPDLMVFNYQVFFDNDDVSLNIDKTKNNLISRDFFEYFQWELSIANISYSPWDKIFKREVIDINDLKFRQDLSSAEDYYWCYQIFKKINKVVSLDAIFYLYRKDRLGSATTTLSNGNLYSTLNALEQSIDDIYLNFSDKEVRDCYLLYSSQLFFFNLPEFFKAKLFTSYVSDRFHKIYKIYINEGIELSQFNRGAKVFFLFYKMLPWKYSVFMYSMFINIRRYVLMKIIRKSR